VKLETARRFALSLEGASEEPHFDSSSFRVKKKIFCTVPRDGGHLHLFVDEATREQTLELYPQCCEKLWWGKKVVGLRLRLADAKPTLVKQLLQQAWTCKSGC
jgi:hypothetical protein